MQGASDSDRRHLCDWNDELLIAAGKKYKVTRNKIIQINYRIKYPTATSALQLGHVPAYADFDDGPIGIKPLAFNFRCGTSPSFRETPDEGGLSSDEEASSSAVITAVEEDAKQGVPVSVEPVVSKTPPVVSAVIAKKPFDIFQIAFQHYLFRVRNAEHLEDLLKLRDWQDVGCLHYNRGCRIVAPCCGKDFSCRLCHNENEEHEIDRYAVEQMICNLCDERQDASNCCRKCSNVMADYYCDICHLWINGDTSVYHCFECGICRVGKKKNYEHCSKCQGCYPKKQRHVCVEGALKNDCPVCLDDLFSSRIPVSILPCGHGMHRNCFRRYKNKFRQCPLCKVSLKKKRILPRRRKFVVSMH